MCARARARVCVCVCAYTSYIRSVHLMPNKNVFKGVCVCVCLCVCVWWECIIAKRLVKDVTPTTHAPIHTHTHTPTHSLGTAILSLCHVVGSSYGVCVCGWVGGWVGGRVGVCVRCCPRA